MIRPNKDQVLAKIDFLETQLENLHHCLPETYCFILEQLDQQQRLLAELEVREPFGMIDFNCA
jgi:hypothetical protein